MKAAQAHTPTPMVVAQHANVLDDKSPVVAAYKVSGGVCGFAWVSIKPANSKFARWLLANNKARKDSYAGGVRLSVSLFNQSMELKEKYAYAFAKMLQEAGIRAYADSRMD